MCRRRRRQSSDGPHISLSAAQGKVRDVYEAGDKLVIVTTDRQSAFDRILAAIPYKVR